MWDDEPPDVRNCSSFAYQELLQIVGSYDDIYFYVVCLLQINFAVDDVGPEIIMESVYRVLTTLAGLVTSSSYSIFPLDIQASHFVISKLLE